MLVQTSAFVKELYVYVVDCDIGAIWIAEDVGYVGVECKTVSEIHGGV